MDITNIKVKNNWVLVKLDDDHNTYHSTEKGTDTGISVAPWGINQASHLALTGVVIALPEKLIYNGYELKVLKREKMRSDEDQKAIAELRKYSTAYDVPIELEVGYRVYFEYTTRLNAINEGRIIEDGEDKYLLLPYDMLVLAFRPGTNFDSVQVNDVYPLNGFVLIKPLEYAREKTAEGIVGVKTEMDLFMPVPDDAKYVHRNNLWYATILIAGCVVKSYADFPDRYDDRYKLEAGMKICYDGRQQKRLEVEQHRVIFKGHVLYRIQRKDMLGIFTNGKIN